MSDSGGIPVVTLARSLADVAQGGAGAATDTAALLFELDSLEHPVAVAFRRDGSIAVVDRTEWKVVLVDSTGHVTGSVGRRGDGPGDLRDPAGIAALGDALIILQSYPTNTLTRFAPGARPMAVTPPIPGDWDGWKWEQPFIGIEFPIQSAPEIWSRRLRALDDSQFIAYVGPVDEDTSTSARAYLLRFGLDLRVRDTVAAFQPPHRVLKAEQDAISGPGMFREVWGARPVWSTGDGVIAVARSDSGRVVVRDVAGKVSAIIRWTPASSPVTEADRAALGDRILQATLALSPGALERYQQTGESERKEMMDQFMATFHLASTRPELVGLFVSDHCLWMAGFDPRNDADGTGRPWFVLDLDHPAGAPRIITIGGPGERVVAIERGRAATILLQEDGTRRVSVYRMPGCRVAA